MRATIYRNEQTNDWRIVTRPAGENTSVLVTWRDSLTDAVAYAYEQGATDVRVSNCDGMTPAPAGWTHTET